jgi:hypothetical protein
MAFTNGGHQTINQKDPRIFVDQPVFLGKISSCFRPGLSNIEAHRVYARRSKAAARLEPPCGSPLSREESGLLLPINSECIASLGRPKQLMAFQCGMEERRDQGVEMHVRIPDPGDIYL